MQIVYFVFFMFFFFLNNYYLFEWGLQSDHEPWTSYYITTCLTCDPCGQGHPSNLMVYCLLIAFLNYFFPLFNTYFLLVIYICFTFSLFFLLSRLRVPQKGQGCVFSAQTSIYMSRLLMTLRCIL